MATQSLPARPNLEQLRKQAKDVHKACESGDPAALARIRQHLPRLAGAADDRILQALPSLQEAQHVLAREHGFHNWNWLRTVVEVDFDLLAQLRPVEVQTLLREVQQRDMVVSLKGAPAAVTQHLLSEMSERVRSFIAEEILFLQDAVDDDAVAQARRRILQQAADLAGRGLIGWPGEGAATRAAEEPPPPPPVSPRLLELAQRPLPDMAVEEIGEMAGEMAARAHACGILALHPLADQCADPLLREGLRLAVDGTEPELIREILTARQSALLHQLELRGRLITEGLVSLSMGDNPTITRYRLVVWYRVEIAEERLGQRGVALGAFQVAELVARLRQTPLLRMELDRVVELFTDMAYLARSRGMGVLQPLVGCLAEPFLRQGFELMLARAERERIRAHFEAPFHQVWCEARARYGAAIAGLGAVQEGKEPEEVARRARQAAS
ncbi:MAG: FliG C-terminal domain-containing protein [Candidatus Latescibacterota bacterium]